MAKNVQGVIFLRNGNPYSTHALALTGIESKKGLVGDGQFILARYYATEDSVQVTRTLVGVKAGDGANGYLTIIDVEGASADVEALKQEINAKLGEGITSENTATAQLEALSGNTASTSADTSVEGAKRYAEDLIGTLDGGVTAETGSYVVSVSEVDGKISGTTTELPTVTGEVESKKVVMSVSEDKGEISVTKGTIESADKTVVISNLAEGNGIDFSVHIDNATLEKDENGVISVTSSALVQYEGDDDTVQIGAVQDGKRIVSSPLTIEKVTTGLDADVKEEYHLVGHSGNTIGQAIKIYKDSSLLSVALLHADTTADPQVLPSYDKATDTWTDIADPTQANQALCFAYENVSGATVIAAVPVGAFINEQEFASGVTWDSAAGKVKGVVDGTSEAFLTVGADGFKLAGVQTAIDNAVSGAVETLDATVNNNANSGHVAVEIVEEDGKLTTVTVTEADIASANDLAGLSGKTITAITSTNGSISASINDAVGNKTADIQTDADKIQMSGFTTDNTKVFSGIAESDSIATAFEKADTVVTGINTKVDALGDDFVSGATVNGTGVTVVDHVIPLVISGTTTTGAEAPAITVNTDASGNVGLEIGYIDCGTYDEQENS